MEEIKIRTVSPNDLRSVIRFVKDMTEYFRFCIHTNNRFKVSIPTSLTLDVFNKTDSNVSIIYHFHIKV